MLLYSDFNRFSFGFVVHIDFEFKNKIQIMNQQHFIVIVLNIHSQSAF